MRRSCKVFRENKWPVIFPHVARKIGHDHGAFSAKIRAYADPSGKGYDFVKEVAPEPGELIAAEAASERLLRHAGWRPYLIRGQRGLKASSQAAPPAAAFVHRWWTPVL